MGQGKRTGRMMGWQVHEMHSTGLTPPPPHVSHLGVITEVKVGLVVYHGFLLPGIEQGRFQILPTHLGLNEGHVGGDEQTDKARR